MPADAPVDPPPDPMVRIVDLWKRYGAAPVLRGVHLEVARGCVLCLLGPSGAG
ncbi:MAG: hypothetical protein JOY70_03515, partial [Acidisphaera sp.]|nr:hypothetical protein [Acidisphaera sp.]